MSDYKPTELEEQIGRAATKAVKTAVLKALTEGYGNPLSRMAGEVISLRHAKFERIMMEALDAIIDTGDFRDAVCDAIRHKLARTMVGKMGGEVEKRVNALLQRPETRARLTLALDKMLAEFSP